MPVCFRREVASKDLVRTRNGESSAWSLGERTAEYRRLSSEFRAEREIVPSYDDSWLRRPDLALIRRVVLIRHMIDVTLTPYYLARFAMRSGLCDLQGGTFLGTGV